MPGAQSPDSLHAEYKYRWKGVLWSGVDSQQVAPSGKFEQAVRTNHCGIVCVMYDEVCSAESSLMRCLGSVVLVDLRVNWRNDSSGDWKHVTANEWTNVVQTDRVYLAG